jgi:hypothetical protein
MDGRRIATQLTISLKEINKIHIYAVMFFARLTFLDISGFDQFGRNIFNQSQLCLHFVPVISVDEFELSNIFFCDL